MKKYLLLLIPLLMTGCVTTLLNIHVGDEITQTATEGSENLADQESNASDMLKDLVGDITQPAPSPGVVPLPVPTPAPPPDAPGNGGNGDGGGPPPVVVPPVVVDPGQPPSDEPDEPPHDDGYAWRPSDGFVFKQKSESDGKTVILDPSSSQRSITVTGPQGESYSMRYAGNHNGDRSHFRADQVIEAFPLVVKGSKTWTVPGPAAPAPVPVPDITPEPGNSPSDGFSFDGRTITVPFHADRAVAYSRGTSPPSTVLEGSGSSFVIPSNRKGVQFAIGGKWLHDSHLPNDLLHAWHVFGNNPQPPWTPSEFRSLGGTGEWAKYGPKRGG